MSKRGLKRDLEEVSDEVLGDLDPEERLQLFLKASAQDNEEWLDRIRETTPEFTYTGPEMAYVDRARFALRFLHHAIYELHTAYLEHQLVEQKIRYQRLLAQTEDSKENRKKTGMLIGERNYLFIDLYTSYHAFQRFARDALGVGFETWFSIHSSGPFLIEEIEELLGDEAQREDAEELLNRDVEYLLDSISESDKEDEPERVTLEVMAENQYHELRELWESAVKDLR